MGLIRSGSGGQPRYNIRQMISDMGLTLGRWELTRAP